MPRPESVCACFLPIDYWKRATAPLLWMLVASGTNTEKPVETLLPLSRGLNRHFAATQNAAQCAALGLCCDLLKQSARGRLRHVALTLHDDLVERAEIGLGRRHQ